MSRDFNGDGLLDLFTKDIARIKQRVGVPDRARLDQYLDSIREVEREIERAEEIAPPLGGSDGRTMFRSLLEALA